LGHNLSVPSSILQLPQVCLSTKGKVIIGFVIFSHPLPFLYYILFILYFYCICQLILFVALWQRLNAAFQSELKGYDGTVEDDDLSSVLGIDLEEQAAAVSHNTTKSKPAGLIALACPPTFYFWLKSAPISHFGWYLLRVVLKKRF
jgi:hypothetical protein